MARVVWQIESYRRSYLVNKYEECGNEINVLNVMNETNVEIENHVRTEDIRHYHIRHQTLPRS